MITISNNDMRQLLYARDTCDREELRTVADIKLVNRIRLAKCTLRKLYRRNDVLALLAKR